MKTFLVTGGCGFIGSHLCEALLDEGHAVRVLDDLSTGQRENLPPAVELIKGDVADPAAVRDALEGVDGCFHLAAIASVERGVTDWLGTHRANLTGADHSVRCDPPAGRRIPVVYASSAAVYGDAATVPIAEATARRPLSAYGADKLGCELHARVASHVHGIPTVGLRFFNVYGPRQDPQSPYSGVISIFCERIAPRRADRHLRRRRPDPRLRLCRRRGDGAAGGDAPAPADAPVFNVCTGIATSVLDLAHTIAELSGSGPKSRYGPPRAGEIRHSIGSPKRRARCSTSRNLSLCARVSPPCCAGWEHQRSRLRPMRDPSPV